MLYEDYIIYLKCICIHPLSTLFIYVLPSFNKICNNVDFLLY